MPIDLPAIRSERTAWPAGALRCVALVVVLVIGTLANLIVEACIIAADRLWRH